ncbi:MAG: hypothetical protein SXA11_05230 [Cyanobacteriota bacterium]|nr:hypothetical protein [Cyanobacteriota bacterium]
MREKAIVIQLTPQQVADGNNLQSLKAILLEHSANQENLVFPVAAMVVGKSHRQLVRFHRRFWMETSEIVDRLQRLDFDVKLLEI